MSKQTILNFAKGKESECKYLIRYDINESHEVNIISATPQKDSTQNTVIGFCDFQDENRKEPTQLEIEKALKDFLTLKK